LSQESTDEEKNREAFFILFDLIKDPELPPLLDLHDQIETAYFIVHLLKDLPFTSFKWNDEDFTVSCFIVWLYCSADILAH